MNSLTCQLHLTANSLVHPRTHSPIHELAHLPAPSNHKLTRPSTHRLASGALTSSLILLLNKITNSSFSQTRWTNRSPTLSRPEAVGPTFLFLLTVSRPACERETHLAKLVIQSCKRFGFLIPSLTGTSGRTEPICNVEFTQSYGARSIGRWFGLAINHSTGDQTNIGTVSRSITRPFSCTFHW
jgi:hypothetical protein